MFFRGFRGPTSDVQSIEQRVADARYAQRSGSNKGQLMRMMLAFVVAYEAGTQDC